MRGKNISISVAAQFQFDAIYSIYYLITALFTSRISQMWNIARLNNVWAISMLNTLRRDTYDFYIQTISVNVHILYTSIWMKCHLRSLTQLASEM